MIFWDLERWGVIRVFRFLSLSFLWRAFRIFHRDGDDWCYRDTFCWSERVAGKNSLKWRGVEAVWARTAIAVTGVDEKEMIIKLIANKWHLSTGISSKPPKPSFPLSLSLYTPSIALQSPFPNPNSSTHSPIQTQEATIVLFQGKQDGVAKVNDEEQNPKKATKMRCLCPLQSKPTRFVFMKEPGTYPGFQPTVSSKISRLWLFSAVMFSEASSPPFAKSAMSAKDTIFSLNQLYSIYRSTKLLVSQSNSCYLFRGMTGRVIKEKKSQYLERRASAMVTALLTIFLCSLAIFQYPSFFLLYSKVFTASFSNPGSLL